MVTRFLKKSPNLITKRAQISIKKSPNPNFQISIQTQSDFLSASNPRIRTFASPSEFVDFTRMRVWVQILNFEFESASALRHPYKLFSFSQKYLMHNIQGQDALKFKSKKTEKPPKRSPFQFVKLPSYT